MILLDANVISELMRPNASANVAEWIDEQPSSDLYLASITVAELLYGIARLPEGRRKMELADAFEQTVDKEFGGRVVGFDLTASTHYADITVMRERTGRPISMADAQIAAIARSHGAQLATRNTSDFEQVGVTLVNPWDDHST